MLNIEFAQPGWRPDPIINYNVSSIAASRCHGFTYLMSMVISGRDPVTGQLNREAELEAFLATPESVAECKRITSTGWTALMIAVRNSRNDSTEKTVAMLLAHESSIDVVRKQQQGGWTTLMLAARHSRTDSTEQTVAMLLAHESSADVARMQDEKGWTALMLAIRFCHTDSTEKTVAMLLAHESSADVIRMKTKNNCTTMIIAIASNSSSIDYTIEMLCEYADEEQLTQLNRKRPDILSRCFTKLRQRIQERETLKQALQQGLSLPGATMLLYV